MTLTEAIHQRWAADEQLAGLVPPERFFTGLSAQPLTPYGVLNIADAAPVQRYNNGGRIDRLHLRIECFHQQFDQAEATLRRIAAVFDLAAFALDDGQQVLLVRVVGHSLRQAEEGTWLARAKLDCAMYRPAGSA